MARLNGGYAEPPHAAPVVQKYGGSSLTTLDQVRSVAERTAVRHRTGTRVVLVVSARGNSTDDLLALAREVGAATPGREVDQLLGTGESASSALLALAVQSAGVPALSLTGEQTGILASGAHGRGTIVAVDTEPITRVLDSGAVAVVAGFQGVNERRDIITLGRGGSDTTAVAIAAELGADHCEIHTDVQGVYTADPRLVPEASRIPRIDVDVMAEMSLAGAKVLHSRAVDLAAAHAVDIHVLHNQRPGPGTFVAARNDTRRDMLESSGLVMSVMADRQVARIDLRLADKDATAQLFDFFARKSVLADMTTLHDVDGGVHVSATVGSADVEAVRSYAQSSLDAARVEVGDDIAKISLVGQALLSSPECAARALRRLRRSGISANAVSTSQLRISITVPAAEATRATRLLHREFELDSRNTDHGSPSPVPV
ncbi:aspartate kinase [Nocardiopsis rhodophaea]|uniref:aspartate kinase n=1 Tax=Nocardiopsis rhodophaea TaxID=280238 RepID=UPI0031D65F37